MMAKTKIYMKYDWNNPRLMSMTPENLKKAEALLGIRPKCLNPGCGKYVSRNGSVRWRHFCGTCTLVSQGKAKPKSHITYVRKRICENRTGKLLGFKCATNWVVVKKYKLIIDTHMDHIDGNPLNNKLSNIQELCPYCHGAKGKLNGDLDGWKNRRN
jgi:hypothetical protein